MAVDLSDLIPDLQSEISPPGSDFFPDATDDELLTNLRNGFWEAQLDGFLKLWTEAEGFITPKDSAVTSDIDRELQQLIIFYAGFRILRASLRNYATRTRAKAGPVEFEQDLSAGIMKDLLKELQEKRSILLTRLSDLGLVPTGYIDAVIQRTENIATGDLWWTAGRMWSDSRW